MNTYGYVGANPVSYFDPKGLQACKCHPSRPNAKLDGISMEQEPLSSEDARRLTLEALKRANIRTTATGILVGGVMAAGGAPWGATVGVEATIAAVGAAIPVREYEEGEFKVRQTYVMRTTHFPFSLSTRLMALSSQDEYS